MTYKSPIYMYEAGNLVRRWRDEGKTAWADELETALRLDQHDIFHDAEFHDGCEICDEEREKYG